MKNWLEKQFRLSEFHTDVKTEILAGLTTFVTMAYILATVPNIMSGAGFDKHVTLTIMILLIIVTTCAMALYTNRPFALAPGLGSVGIIASMITNEGVSAPIAAGVIFWSGVLFIIISFFGTAGSRCACDSSQPETVSKCRYRSVYCASGSKKLWADRSK